MLVDIDVLHGHHASFTTSIIKCVTEVEKGIYNSCTQSEKKQTSKLGWTE